MNKEVGVFHRFICEKIAQKQKIILGKTIELKRNKLREYLWRQRIPCNLHDRFIKEMESMDLIEVKDHMNVVVKKCKFV